MAEKKPKKLKYVSEDFVGKCSRMEQNDLIQELKTRLANLADYQHKKSNDEFLKEARKEIADYRKDWKKENPKLVAEFEAFKESYNSDKDKKIEDDLVELKDLEYIHNESINGAKEYIEVVIESIRIV